MALVAGLVLLLNTAARRATADVSDLPRRHWEDTLMAVGLFVGDPQAERVSRESNEGEKLYERLRNRLIRTAQMAGIRPWEFWRTVRHGAIPRDSVLAPRFSDDTGRSRLAAAGFRIIGGVSPFLVTWVGALFVLPLFVWTAIELVWSGRGVAAGVFLGLVGASAFFVDVLSLSYSAAGFSVIAVLLVVPLAVYGVLNPSPSVGGWLTRGLLAGLFLAVCILCRSGAILVLAGFAAAMTGAWRLSQRTLPRLALGGAALALVVLPFILVRPDSYHEAWLGIWEGLGDFDRTKGHFFYDPEARKVLAEAGIVIPTSRPVWSRPAETEPFFRERVLRAIRDDPAWYGGILLKRAAATLTQAKLLPSRAETGRTYAPRQHPQQGHIDVYYGMTATADVFTVGRREWEAPLWLLWLPLLTLIVGAVGFVPAWRSEVALLAIVALAALTQPVLVTTAGAHETQAFLLVYLLAAALLGARLVPTGDPGAAVR